MRKATKMKTLVSVLSLTAVTFSAGVFAINPAKAATEATMPTPTTFEMVEGASVRTEAPSGIRFVTYVNTAWMNEQLDNGATFGTIVAPASNYTGAVADFAHPDTDDTFVVEDIKHTETANWGTDGDYTVLNAVLTEIPETYYGTDIVARSYMYADLTDDGVENPTYTYASNPQARTIAEVASKAIADGETESFLYDTVDAVVDGLDVVKIKENSSDWLEVHSGTPFQAWGGTQQVSHNNTQYIKEGTKSVLFSATRTGEGGKSGKGIGFGIYKTTVDEIFADASVTAFTFDIYLSVANPSGTYSYDQWVYESTPKTVAMNANEWTTVTVTREEYEYYCVDKSGSSYYHSSLGGDVKVYGAWEYSTTEIKDGLYVDNIQVVKAKTETCYELTMAETLDLKAKLTFNDALVSPNVNADYEIIWSSSDETVAKVENGLVTPLKGGEARITATIGRTSKSVKVVIASDYLEVYDGSIYGTNRSTLAINTDTAYIKEGAKSLKFTATENNEGGFGFYMNKTPIGEMFADESVTAITFDIYVSVANPSGEYSYKSYRRNTDAIQTAMNANEWTTVTVTRGEYVYNCVDGKGSSYYKDRDGADLMLYGTVTANTDAVYVDNIRVCREGDVTTLQFNFYGYTGPTDGTYTINGTTTDQGTDFRTVARLKEYKAAGMTVYFLGTSSGGEYHGAEWETCETKQMMDTAYWAGLNKAILVDNRIEELSKTVGGVIGEGKAYATEAALDAQIKAWMAPYVDHPAFYGVILADEPSFAMAEAYGQVYRSIKRVYPETFVQYNLLPMVNSMDERYPTLENTTGMTEDEIRNAKYRLYLETFVEATGADHVMFDRYPMAKDSIYDSYLPCLQIAAEVAKKYDIALHVVTQTMKMTAGGQELRGIDEANAYWLNNMLIGFGVKEIAYFTYWTKQVSNESEQFIDGYSFINHDGTKTELYSIMQKIMAEAQLLAPTVLTYDYNASAVYQTNACSSHSGHLTDVMNASSFAKIASVTVDDEAALVTELKNAEGGYMYMVQNIADPICTDDDNTTQTVTLTFADGVTEVELWENGVSRTVTITDGTLTLTHTPGQATYVVVK